MGGGMVSPKTEKEFMELGESTPSKPNKIAGFAAIDKQKTNKKLCLSRHL